MTSALKLRKFASLEWVIGPELKVTWLDGTVSWFNGSPEVLATKYGHRVSTHLIEEATLAYAEFVLTPKTMADRLKARTAFTQKNYEETSK